jgi:2-polyprenyl-3-methyl-5-hydroxy-6-metoxy-1,4-benzoquinol methylase
LVVDNKKLDEFLGKVVGEWGAALDSLLIFVGDRLKLYTAMTGNDGPIKVTPESLAAKTGTHPRMIKEWLFAQAAGGYVEYDAEDGTFTLPEEKALALTDENSPAYIQGAYQLLVSLFKDEEKIIQAMRSGKGLGWGDHHPYLFEGTERFLGPVYVGSLTSSWIPSLDGVEDKLKKGAKVADVGCGYGVTTILMGKAFPNSQVIGFDSHLESIEKAKAHARKEGLTNVTFELGNSTTYKGNHYDLVTFFDCIHDMGDPSGASKHALETLKDDGTLMVVEPFANDKPEQNLNPIGRIMYAASTLVCVPASLKEDGPALGAQAGQSKLENIIRSVGFSKFRRATETPFNLVFEARP